ncbi:dinitrogenase iron-molybdenum cofactor, partial [Clostridium autoethanogenum]
MGETAQQLYNENEIKVLVGANGFCDDIVTKTIKGNLKTNKRIRRKHKNEKHLTYYY